MVSYAIAVRFLLFFCFVGWVSRRSTHPTREDVAGRVKPGHDGAMSLCVRRRGPRPLRAAQAFEGLGHAEHAEIVEAAADDLHADRETLGVVAAIDRDRGV